MADPDLLPPGTIPTLEELSACCAATPEFQATSPTTYVLPGSA